VHHLAAALLLAGFLAGSAWGEPNNGDRCSQDNAVRQRYNPYSDTWETTRGEKELRYNPHEDEWSYEDPDATFPVYNPHEDRWEYPK